MRGAEEDVLQPLALLGQRQRAAVLVDGVRLQHRDVHVLLQPRQRLQHVDVLFVELFGGCQWSMAWKHGRLDTRV